MHGTGPEHARALRRGPHTAADFRQRELVVVERFDHPEQPFRVTGCDRDHVLSVPHDLCPKSNVIVARVR